MIIFVGNKESGFFLQELQNPDAINYTGYINLNELKKYILQDDYSCIVIDISLWSEDCNIIAETISDVAVSTRSKIIIFAVGYQPGSNLCQSLLKHGIKSIITAGNLADIKNEFLLFYNSESQPVIKKYNTQVFNHEVTHPNAITISVAGTQERIGTTTQCFQIVKYLTAKGYKTAYLEFNDTDYLKKMKNLFRINENDFSFEGINIYSKEQINKVIRDFDYIVYDYGCITNKSFNQYSFLERNISIIVCGAKPGEIEYSTHALGLFQKYIEVIYLFNFVSKSDENDIKIQMGDKKTFFSPLIPDMFSVLLPQQNLYDEILNINDSPSVVKKKKSFFSKRRK